MAFRHFRALLAVGVAAGLLAARCVPTSARVQAPAAALPLYTTPADFGARGDGKTDDTAALRAALAATPDNGCLLIPPGAAYVVSAPLYLFSRDGLCVRSPGATDTSALGKRGGEFIWRGPAGAAALFQCNYVRRATFENITLSLDGNATPPAAGFSFDMYPDPAGARPTITNTTRCTVRGCTIIMPPGVTACDGIALSQQSRFNVEYCCVDGCTIQPPGSQPGSGTGVHVYASANAKGIRCRDVSVSYAAVGFHWESGSGHLDGCTGTGNGVFVRADLFVDPLTIRNCNAEGCGVAVALKGQDAPATIESNRFVVAGTAAFDLQARQTVLRGNRIYCPAPAKGAAAPAGFVPHPNAQYAVARDANLWSVISGNDGWLGTRSVGPLEWERNY